MPSEYEDANAALIQQNKTAAAPAGDYLTGFVRSFMETFPGLIGQERSPENQAWQAENPVSGFVSEALPLALTYGGWAKLTTKIPAVAGALAGIDAAGASPVLGGFAREAARFAPFELGRIGVSAATGGDTADVAEGAAFNELLAGAAGGVGGLIKSGGRMAPAVPPISKSVNLDQSPSLILRDLKATALSGQTENPEADQFWINRLANQVKAESPGKQPLVAPLEGQEKPNSALNTLMRKAKRFIPQHWDDAEALAKAGDAAGVNGNEEFMQFPRFTEAVDDKAAQSVAKTVTENLQSVNEDTWLGKESSDGLWVVAKRIEQGPLRVTRGVVETPETGYVGRGSRKNVLDRGVLEGKAPELPVNVRPPEFNPEALVNPERLPYNVSELDQGVREPVEQTKPTQSASRLDKGIREGADEGIVTGDRTRETNFNPGDKWVLFKTDQPGRFMPQNAAWTNKIVNAGAWKLNDLGAPIGTEINDALQNAKKYIGFRNFTDTAPEAEWLKKTKAATGADTLTKGPGAQAGQQAYQFMKEFGAPSTWQFNSSPRANYIFAVARATFDSAQSIANGIMFGAQKLEGKYSLLNNVLVGTRGTTTFQGRLAVNDAIEALSEADLWDAWRGQNAGWDDAAVRAAVEKGEISPKAGEFLTHLSDIDKTQFGELNKTQAVFEQKLSKALPGHRMISNTFKGDIRIPLFDEKGNLITLASGHNVAEAQREAKFLLENAEKNGAKWKAGIEGKNQDWFTSDYSTDLHSLLAGEKGFVPTARQSDFSLARNLREQYVRGAGRPGGMKYRSGMEGFVGEAAPWTKAELKQIIGAKVNSYQKFMADLNVRSAMKSDLAKLANENPSISNQLLQRMDQMMGKQGEFSKWQNTVSDKLLAPYLGKNTATKLVSAINGATHHFQLGMLNLNFPIVNALGFLQTALPHVSFIMSAPKENLAKYYGWAVAAGADGTARAPIGFLDMAKLTGRSFKELRKPSEALLDMMGRAQREGVTDPKLIEEFAGENSNVARRLQDAWGSPQGVTGWIKAVSNFMPAASERFARAHAFTLGHIVGRDFLGLEGENLYQFGKNFTNKTMFGYSTVDRAKVLSGPMGSLVGLYKNWQMHYLGWLMEYSGQAAHGNMAPLAWMAGGTAAVGGVAASPFYFLADGMSRMFANKSAMQLIYDHFGGVDDESKGTYSDAVYYGLPSFLGLSLQGSVSAPGASPVRDAAMLFSIVQWKRMQELGAAVGGAIDAYSTTGNHPITDTTTRDAFIQAFAPRSMIRLTQALESGVIKSMNTGNSLAAASPVERAMYALGMSPVNVERQLDAAEELYTDQNKMNAAVKSFGSAWQQATDKGDSGELNNLMKRATAQGVPIDSIVRSAVANKAKQDQDIFTRRFKIQKILEKHSMIGNTFQ